LAAEREERPRVLGIRIGPGFGVWVDDAENRVLGFPVEWLRRLSPGGGPGRARRLPGDAAGDADGGDDRQDRGRSG
jgi:hypothetical protein